MIWPFKRASRAGNDDERIRALLVRATEHERRGELSEAEECGRELLSLAPQNGDACRLLAQVLALRAGTAQASGAYDAAIEAYEESSALDPGRAQVHNNLGNAYRSAGRLEEAIASFREAIALDAGLAEAQFNLGNALYQAGDPAAAIAHCRAALAIRPAFAEASLTLGFLLEQEGDAEGALEGYRDAMLARPDYAEAHFNHALQLLLRGDYAAGWREYEWRKRLPGMEGAWTHEGREDWAGSPIEGSTILLYAEQGFGDVIQFVRYAPLVAARGGRVVVSCQPKLKGVVATVPGVSAAIGTGEPVPGCDERCSLLGLPLAFGTTLQTIPAQVPYVAADPAKALAWKARLEQDRARVKVGLYWATESKSRISPLRSLALDAFAPLAAVPGVSFYSLQRGEAAAQLAAPPAGMRIQDCGPMLGDFSDDAALMANLDLVISIDTATAHLAGALGRPVWTLTHFPPDWRWLRERSDSPWYPTMRLFRRGRGDRWGDVIARVAVALRDLAC